jgi:hypothetical protein
MGSEGETDWAAAIGAARRTSLEVVTAHTFVKAWTSFSRPVALQCSDERTYVVKGNQPTQPVMPHAMTSEQVVGRLGHRLKAPIPHIVIVHIPSELIEAEPEMAHLSPGLAHGSALVPNCSDRVPIDQPTTQRNREAYARLAVLYGWALAGDHQIVKTLDADGDVYSVDHGHFFPGGPAWSAQSLQGHTTPALPDPQFVGYADPAALAATIEAARNTTDSELAALLAFSPASWGVSADDLFHLGQYLGRQRETL